MAHGQWSEIEARGVLSAQAKSGMSVEQFARERGFTAQERARASAERSQEHRDEAREYEQWQQRRSSKRGFN